ncbi:MAG: 4Fe-4S binding protein [Thermoanaerobacteraceae bacterium]|nr:4Fe-4S binding protein [Thermoanaerobacteraceae bacterium]
MNKTGKFLLKSLFKKPISEKFPKGPLPEMSENYRGFPKHKPEKCIGCGICIYFCPTNAIRMEDNTDGKIYIIDKGKCISCKQCADACPMGAIEFINTPVMSVFDKKNMVDTTKVEFVKCKSCGELMPKPALLATKNLKKKDNVPSYLFLCPKCRRVFEK